MDSTGKMLRLGLLYAVYFGTIAVIFPFFAIYLNLRGFSPSRIGLILAATEAAGVTAPFVLGRLADRTGRYRSVMAVMVLITASALLLLHQVSFFPLVLLSAFIYGFFFKPLSGLADALSGRVLSDSSANYGKVRLGGTLGFILVSLTLQSIGVMESNTAGRYMTVFLIALLVLFMFLPLSSAVPPHEEVDHQTPRTGLRGMPPGYYSLLGLSLFGNIGFAIHQSFASLYYSEIVGVAAVGGLFALAAFTEIPSLFFGGRILKALGHRRMLFLALGAGALRLIILALFPSTLPIYLSQLTHALIFGFYIIAGVDWVNRKVHSRSRALGMGLFVAAVFSGAQLLGSAFGGYLLEFGGFRLLFGVGAGFPVAGMLWMLIDRRIGRIGGTDSEISTDRN